MNVFVNVFQLCLSFPRARDFPDPYRISSVMLIMWLTCIQIWLSCILHILSCAENETYLYWISSAILIMWLGYSDMIYLNLTPSSVLHYPLQYWSNQTVSGSQMFIFKPVFTWVLKYRKKKYQHIGSFHMPSYETFGIFFMGFKNLKGNLDGLWIFWTKTYVSHLLGSGC